MSGNFSCTPGDGGSRSRLRIALIFLIIALVGAWLLFRETGHDDHEGHNHAEHADEGQRSSPQGKSPHQLVKANRPGDPVGEYEYLYDKAPGANRFLISKALSRNFLPDSDAPAGRDLWIQDENGKERLLAEDVYRARFSPDGSKIAYTTADCVMHIEDLNGKKVGEVPRAYEPNWRSDSGAIVYAAVPDGRPVHVPEVLGLAVYDVASGTTKKITDGQWDDVRPQYDPSDEWILFVSGARSGLASFWKVPVDGGVPEQVTNVGVEEVNEQFVPTPYDRTIWSPDKKWFVYDFKSGDDQQIWALQFDENGKLVRPIRLGAGLDPRWADDGKRVVAIRNVGGRDELTEYALP